MKEIFLVTYQLFFWTYFEFLRWTFMLGKILLNFQALTVRDLAM